MEATNTPMKGWQRASTDNSLPDVHSSVHVPKNSGFFRTLMAYFGPGLMVAVGYMDPGNWATDIAGGAQFGYRLLSVVLISNLFAILLQHLSLKLGIVTGRDLAQACRDHYSRPVAVGLWVLAEIAIAATDLAEVIGSAIALNLLFGLPITVGILITALDVLLLLYLQNKGFQTIERIVASLIFLIIGCFGYELFVSRPAVGDVLSGLLPRTEIVTNPAMLYIAIGILGATVMPHNLYLHSSIVQTRDFGRDDEGRQTAIKFATIDSTVSLFLAFFINAAILILSAATFHFSGNQHVADITDAHRLLDPILGVKLAGILFAVALLASGQNSTLTGTLAGQIVMEGFLELRIKPWLRRLITRLVAIVPALIVAILYGEQGTSELLVFSQVVLSLQLSFAVFPLVSFTNDKLKMGRFVNPGWVKVVSWVVAVIIMGLNGYLLWDTLF
ncbi:MULTISPECIES: Nramp family divalent metal transporter [Spirosoma]|uniref:Divalent metal cation transporter MntH n=1 Tax=Spirosoma liriopis TaxID=2937440 RepID=A0ABT0HS01_9BACT|nr:MULTISPECIES: Nramp family divalent metal transporter [Spirosoma]MCK8494408.1 Nramp family divalent metal transporter [Spirosoma liriopis]UHG89419.1 Nramp family divalent metal transporter [Spirosoma oryzicola]